MLGLFGASAIAPIDAVGLFLEHRLPRDAAVHRFEHAAGARTHVIDVGIAGHADNGGDASARHRRSQVADAEPLEGVDARGIGRGVGRRLGRLLRVERGRHTGRESEAGNIAAVENSRTRHHVIGARRAVGGLWYGLDVANTPVAGAIAARKKVRAATVAGHRVRRARQPGCPTRMTYMECTANMPPCGSWHCAMRLPPGTSMGPFNTLPPFCVTRSAARSALSTRT